MAGDEEAKARASLAAMLDRIAKGPHAALGVTHTATHQEVRAAFLGLTKRFHPAKFARLSTELQKLSNEVFLGIKSAHDLLANGSSLRNAKTAGTQPIPKAESSTVLKPQGGPVTSPLPKGPSGAFPSVGKPATASQQPLAKPAGNGRPPTPPTGVLAAGTSLPRKDPTPAVPAKPAVPAASGPVATSAPASTPDERTALEQAMALIKEKNWAAARQALHSLVGRAPQTTQYRALLCFVRGRESHASGRVDDARIEYERALQLDPDLTIAKQAVVELLRRR